MYTWAVKEGVGVVKDDEEVVDSAKVDDASDMTELGDLVPVLEVVGLAGEDIVVLVSSTGQIVVYSDTSSVVTWPSEAGQLVTVGAHDVIVYTLVE